MKKLTVGSLFAGIGGIDLGLERAGMRVAWQCEIDPYARRVLARHWPDVPCYEDVTAIDYSTVDQVDVLAGGFPCQDLSYAGKRAGLRGERSGLFYEVCRAIRDLGPRYILLENVPGLLTLGMGTVLGELAALGYNVEWESIPAAAFGAPHIRYRVFIVAYAKGNRLDSLSLISKEPRDTRNSQHINCEGCALPMAYANGKRCENPSQRQAAVSIFSGGCPQGANWATEPDVGRVANGVPSRVDRLRCLGNAVVPQVAEWIGGRIMQHATAAR